MVGPSITLVSPHVVTTAQLQSGQDTVTLFGIQGYAGTSAAALQAYLDFAGERVTCEPQGPQAYICVMADGNDLAAMALANGDARTTPDAPDFYRQLEAAALAGQQGIWRPAGTCSGAPTAGTQHPSRR